MPDRVSFVWKNGASISDEVLKECSRLFSNHYGTWSLSAPINPGRPIILSAQMLKKWLCTDYSSASLAYHEDQLIGHAFSIRQFIEPYGYVTWVTQLVVDQKWRKRGIATRLLNSIWAFSNDYAWGLVTANPYTVRALENATRRRCIPKAISNRIDILKIASKPIDYARDAEFLVDNCSSIIDTKFHVNHADLDGILESVRPKSWRLGKNLKEGQEWLAFTFKSQKAKPYARSELEVKFAQSEQILQEAYGRMALDDKHSWAQHADVEVDFIEKNIRLSQQSSILDFGCGQGRHAKALSRRGHRVHGIDFLEGFVSKAKSNCPDSASFQTADCRSIELKEKFDIGLCLYDVIGSYANDDDNYKILENLIAHVKPGGHVLISVMNMDLTADRAKLRGDVFARPKLLDKLKPSNTMQQTGNVFDPKYYLIDSETNLVYRKEQFSEDNQLSAELVVRDRRYRRAEIEGMCRKAGAEPIWTRYVQAGKWDEELEPTDSKAKEILLFARKESQPVENA